jgi:hypothetical protein
MKESRSFALTVRVSPGGAIGTLSIKIGRGRSELQGGPRRTCRTTLGQTTGGWRVGVHRKPTRQVHFGERVRKGLCICSDAALGPRVNACGRL